SWSVWVMSALPPKADIGSRGTPLGRITTEKSCSGSQAEKAQFAMGEGDHFWISASAHFGWTATDDYSSVFHLSNFTPGFARSDDMNCKSDQIRAAWNAGDRIGALRIAARFFDRSTDTRTFKRGIDAYNNPDFYRQLGKPGADSARRTRCVGEAIQL